MKIFETVHGSHLYGLAHAGSDADLFIVYADDRKMLQEMHGDDDITTSGLRDFLDKALGGSHQSLEALFSPVKVWSDLRYYSMLEGLRVPAGPVREKYRRTIHRFSFGDFKRRRHALRLALNLRDLTLHGRFNPRLLPEQAEMITEMAEQHEGEALYAVAHQLMGDL